MRYENLQKFIDNVLYLDPNEEIELLNIRRPNSQLGKNYRYDKVGCGFDIETTSCDGGSFMYAAMFSFGNDSVLMRTWDEVHELFERLEVYGAMHNVIVLIWIANFKYEFNFMCKRFKFENVFARNRNRPIYCTLGNHIEIRDALQLSGKGGLKELSRKYTKSQKKVGQLDYTKLRNSQTTLTETEKDYCFTDVEILTEFFNYWADLVVEEGLEKIPITFIGTAREHVKKHCKKQYNNKMEKVYEKISSLLPRSYDAYRMERLKLFRGGLSHSNRYETSTSEVDKTIDNVVGFDIDSSYPSVMCHYKYPMTKFREIKDLKTDGRFITDERLKSGQLAFKLLVEIKKLDTSSKTTHTFEDVKKVVNYKGRIDVDNKRILYADKICVYLTEIDYFNYCDMYNWESLKVIKCFIAEKDYLPDYLIKSVLELYTEKRKLKLLGLSDTPAYANVKVKLNSLFGMCLTAINEVEWAYNDEKEWYQQGSKESYGRQKCKQFLSPYWGIWITAYARRKLVKAITAIDKDRFAHNVIYYDTDSLYVRDCPEVRAYIEKCNKTISTYNRRDDAPKKGISFNDYAKEIGQPDLFDSFGAFEPIDNGAVYRFKTLGTKRYCKVYDNAEGERTAVVTVSGMRYNTYQKSMLHKKGDIAVYEDDENGEKKVIGYINEKEFFKKFKNLFELDVTQSESLFQQIMPYPYSATVTDEEGNTEEMHEESGLLLVPVPYKLTMDQIYYSLLTYINDNKGDY